MGENVNFFVNCNVFLLIAWIVGCRPTKFYLCSGRSLMNACLFVHGQVLHETQQTNWQEVANAKLRTKSSRIVNKVWVQLHVYVSPLFLLRRLDRVPADMRPFFDNCHTHCRQLPQKIHFVVHSTGAPTRFNTYGRDGLPVYGGPSFFRRLYFYCSFKIHFLEWLLPVGLIRRSAIEGRWSDHMCVMNRADKIKCWNKRRKKL